MSDWRPKRFWTETSVVACDGGYEVRLDQRPVRTPAKRPLVLPTEALAEAIAAEWQAQSDHVDPETMPMTRSSNSALDKVTPQFDEVADMLAAYGETDLLCHRAGHPEALCDLQREAWDPLLDWARRTLGAPLVPVIGIMAADQPAESLAALRAQVRGRDVFALTALHDVVALSGSLIIGLAALDEVKPAQELWRISRVDEDWQQSQWGVDDEAAAKSAYKRLEFLHAAQFHRLSRRLA